MRYIAAILITNLLLIETELVVAQLPPLPQSIPSPKTYQHANMVKGGTLQLKFAAASVVPPPPLYTLNISQPDYDGGEGWTWDVLSVDLNTGVSTWLATVGTNQWQFAVSDFSLFTVRPNHYGVKGEPR